MNVSAQCTQFQGLLEEGDVFFKQEQYEQAIKKYNAAILICPENAQLAQQKLLAIFKAIEDLILDEKNAKIKAQFEKENVRKEQEKTRKALSESEYLKNQYQKSLVKLDSQRKEITEALNIAKSKEVEEKKLFNKNYLLTKILDYKQKDPTIAFRITQKAISLFPDSLFISLLFEIYNKSNFYYSNNKIKSNYDYSNIIYYNKSRKVVVTDTQNNIYTISLDNDSTEYIGKSKNKINHMYFLADEPKLLTISSNYGITLWDINKKKIEKEFIDSTSGVKKVFSSNNNKLIYTINDNNSISIWDMKSNKLLKILKLQSKIVDLVFYKNGYFAAICYPYFDKKAFASMRRKNHNIIIFNKNGNRLHSFSIIDLPISASFISKQKILIGFENRKLSLLEIINSLIFIKVIIWENGNNKNFISALTEVSSILYIEKNNQILVGQKNGDIFLLSTNGDILKDFKGHSDKIINLYMINENDFMSISLDGTIKKWSLAPLDNALTFSIEDYHLSPNFSPINSNEILISTYKNILKYNLSSKKLDSIYSFQKAKHFQRSKFIKNGDLFLLYGDSLLLLDRNFNRLQSFDKKSYIREVIISKDENFLISISKPKFFLDILPTKIKIYDINNPKPIKSYKLKDMYELFFFNEKKFITIGKKVYIYLILENDKLLKRKINVTNKKLLSTLTLNNDLTQIIFGYHNTGEAILFDITNNNNIRKSKFKVFTDGCVHIIKISPNGKHIIFGGTFGNLNICYDKTCNKYTNINTFLNIDQIIISPNSNFIAIYDYENNIVSIFSKTGKFIKTFKFDNYKLSNIQFSQDERYILTLADNWLLNVWNIEITREDMLRSEKIAQFEQNELDNYIYNK
jgi:WD40 repeat protein